MVAGARRSARSNRIPVRPGRSRPTSAPDASRGPTTMTTTQDLPNARPRKQLADQLDRLDEQLQRHDQILDALAEGLNAAVTDAARQGTEQAVKAAVVTLLTDPDLRTALHTASAPPRDARLSAWDRLKAAVRSAAARVTQAARATVAAVAHRVVLGVAAVGRAVARARGWVYVRAAARALTAGLAVLALVRAGAAGRLVSLAGRARTAAIGRVAVVRAWARATGCRAAAV